MNTGACYWHVPSGAGRPVDDRGACAVVRVRFSYVPYPNFGQCSQKVVLWGADFRFLYESTELWRTGEDCPSQCWTELAWSGIGGPALLAWCRPTMNRRSEGRVSQSPGIKCCTYCRTRTYPCRRAEWRMVGRDTKRDQGRSGSDRTRWVRAPVTTNYRRWVARGERCHRRNDPTTVITTNSRRRPTEATVAMAESAVRVSCSPIAMLGKEGRPIRSRWKYFRIPL